MKELFREQDFTRVAFFQNVLEAEGIPTFIRNQHLTGSGLTEIPIPEFFPALCVMRDDDYETAVEIIRSHLVEDSTEEEVEVQCLACGEINPGNFAQCWMCGAEIPGS
ncbi:MAG: DUF2007 domain-containing protein [Akkermansiaceae bacterium]|jgi:hypothetical protein|nr:DUF2007 domain-containing protein [Akkermansiaceae bacterium]